MRSGSWQEREQQILDHVGLYRLSLRAIIERRFFDGGKAGNVIQRLLRGGWNVDQPVYVLRPDGARLRAQVEVFGAEPVALLPGAAVDRPGLYKLELPDDVGVDATRVSVLAALATCGRQAACPTSRVSILPLVQNCAR